MLRVAKFRMLFVAFLICTSVKAQQVNINWPVLMSYQDIINDTLTANWSDGLFTGNGLMGDLAYMLDSSTLRFDIGRTDVYDHRHDPKLSHLYSDARLPIGYFTLKVKGKILHNTARLDLWNAEVNGIVETDLGKIKWRTLTLSQSNIVLIETESSGNEPQVNLQWIPEKSYSPRAYAKPESRYEGNPAGKWDSTSTIKSYNQSMLAGGSYVTAWAKNKNITFISVGYMQQGQSAKDSAVNTVKSALSYNLDNAIATHRSWWHAFYQKSFFSIPDARMQSFYWIQLYKLASATRSGKPAIDLQGPWATKTPWPGYWFNLNEQLTYSPLYMSNHLDIASSLIQMIDANADSLYLNVPKQYQYNAISVGRAGDIRMRSQTKVTNESDSTKSGGDHEMGNLTWMLYYYWEQYQYSMDPTVRTKLIPLLKKSINYFLDVMNKDEKGIIHLPYTYSPEYPKGITRDCNYALSLFMWGCKTLLELAPKDELASQWKDVVTHLTPYPTDSTGLRIGRDVGFATSHRHYSHMLMIYPLQLMNWEQMENRALITQSLMTWHQWPSALQGYSFTGGASMYEMMGKGDEAAAYLDRLLNKYVRHNTMYLESGPVIETPLAAAQTIQEMALQCRDGKIFVFHAIPHKWKDAAIDQFRTEGAFLLSGVYRDGATKWIKVTATVNGVVNVVVDLAQARIKLPNGTITTAQIDKDGSYPITLKKGESAFLFVNEQDLNLPISASTSVIGRTNYWGVKLAK